MLDEGLSEGCMPLVHHLQDKWQSTEDSEKPAAVAITVGAVVAQIAIGATIDAVDKIPVVRETLELLGLAVTGVFAYRYITDPDERCGQRLDWAGAWGPSIRDACAGMCV